MNDKPALAHDCARVTNMQLPMASWADQADCGTCKALDAIWQAGHDRGQGWGEYLGRSKARHERTEQLTTVARIVLLLVIMGFLIDIINHRAAAEVAAE